MLFLALLHSPLSPCTYPISLQCLFVTNGWWHWSKFASRYSKGFYKRDTEVMKNWNWYWSHLLVFNKTFIILYLAFTCMIAWKTNIKCQPYQLMAVCLSTFLHSHWVGSKLCVSNFDMIPIWALQVMHLQLGHKSQLFLLSFQLRYPTSSIGLKSTRSSILWESMSDKSYANPNTTSWVWLSSTSLLRSATRFSMLVSVELSLFEYYAQISFWLEQKYQRHLLL